MDNFWSLFRRSTRITFFFLSLCLASWALFPVYRPVSAGLIVGTLAGIANAFYLAWKVNRLGQTAVDRSGKRILLGYWQRALIALLAVMVAKRYGFEIIPTIVGIFFFQLATLLVGAASLWRTK